MYTGRVYVVDPGSGPADPPRLVKLLEIPGLLTFAGQIDSEGYLWLATPDLDPRGGPHDRSYVLDPHSGTVHRVIALPRELRAVADVNVGPERVYVRSWRDGFSAAIGTVPRACVRDATQCQATLFTELGNVGLTPERSLHLTQQALYSFSNSNSRDGRRSIDRINLDTGAIVQSSPLENEFAFDSTSFYAVGQFIQGRNELVRLDRETLTETARAPSPRGSLIAVQYPFVYTSSHLINTVEVHDAETLELIRTIDVTGAGGVNATFGFVAPGVLMLNGNTSLDVSTGALLRDPAEVTFGALQLAVRLPEGHPLAY